MKINLKIVIFIMLLINSNLLASYKITMQELIAISSSNSSIPIVLSENIDKSTYIYYDDVLTSSNVNNILSKLLNDNDYELVKIKNVFYIRKKDILEDIDNNYVFKINYLNEKQISKILSFFVTIQHSRKR